MQQHDIAIVVNVNGPLCDEGEELRPWETIHIFTLRVSPTPAGEASAMIVWRKHTGMHIPGHAGESRCPQQRQTKSPDPLTCELVQALLCKKEWGW